MYEEDSNTSSNPAIQDIVEQRMSRRGALRFGLGTAGAAVLGSFSVAACGGGSDAEVAAAPAPAAGGTAPPTPLSLGFNAVAKSLADVVTVPAGYTATVLYALGDPLDTATPEFKNDGTDTSFETRAGDHHDGIEWFGLSAAGTRSASASDRGLLAMNHEAITDQFLHANGVTANPRPAAEADKEMAAHGISVVEVRRTNGRYAYARDSALNRRITPLTPMQMSGPVRGHALLKTKYSAAGTDTRGTINNCGASTTPWGTYFSGEENWVNYFTRASTDDAARGGNTAKSVVSLSRYGKAQGAASRHGWETAGIADAYARWNVSQAGTSTDGTDDYRNEMNTFGWMVEVDPYEPAVAARKRTALGRFAHEMGVFGVPQAGKPLAVYMGDDSRGEYIYKFVSTANWDANDANAANRMATGDKYLDSGRLYAAKFNADGTGQWIELTIANSTIASYAAYRFADQADVLVNARLAADAVGATKMDRPEWSAVHPVTGEVYVTLTNNGNRKVEPSASSQQALDAANPRSYTDAPTAATAPGNINGHIIRFRDSEPGATAFSWDIYLFGAESGMDAAKVNLSGLSGDRDFSSPDGVRFSAKTGLLYIETDDGAYTDVTNCMLLIAKPGQVGDGATQSIEYTKADGSKLTVQTRVGAKPTAANLRRFLVGPKDCEITGITETPDGRALIVNIQHPGETIAKANIADPSRFLSHWPANAGYGAGGANGRPRSATIVITRNDGGLIGADGTAVLNNL
ncbi:PhoX family protein [Ramlibacter albus]|uniref:PhoX family phosphatase n=1 Tax=Ramlibacter albus TaxID=2079448 RepID=A0A923MC29_9BURK|nr:PhoX family phosphatase [Ramlibacter albus]MBC5766644.1 PhoX family phosphatase [Ramlibacter albus]